MSGNDFYFKLTVFNNDMSVYTFDYIIEFCKVGNGLHFDTIAGFHYRLNLADIKYFMFDTMLISDFKKQFKEFSKNEK